MASIGSSSSVSLAETQEAGSNKLPAILIKTARIRVFPFNFILPSPYLSKIFFVNIKMNFQLHSKDRTGQIAGN